MLQKCPISPNDEKFWTYDGKNAQEYLFVLETVGYLHIPGTDNRHLLPEIIDPWVLWRLVWGILHLGSLDRTPFGENWRMIGAAKRMAKRINAHPLAEALAHSEEKLKDFPPKLLDTFDKGTFLDEYRTLGFTKNTMREASLLLVDAFIPLIEKPECDGPDGLPLYGNGHPMLVALAIWVEANLPRKVCHSNEAWRKQIKNASEML
ncbi:hypothetical protein [Pseudovibrio sp. FO-BEG1]|uniref:hypothetical protein n=1 Tax=Pseudovibrio sp. (strain FO-BEG1) TaxID=911045 RepID=UPI0005A1B444|nr:hypothetical protein [Pseudovibrio sp. FO-BEG1]